MPVPPLAARRTAAWYSPAVAEMLLRVGHRDRPSFSWTGLDASSAPQLPHACTPATRQVADSPRHSAADASAGGPIMDTGTGPAEEAVSDVAA